MTSLENRTNALRDAMRNMAFLVVVRLLFDGRKRQLKMTMEALRTVNARIIDDYELCRRHVLILVWVRIWLVEHYAYGYGNKAPFRREESPLVEKVDSQSL